MIIVASVLVHCTSVNPHSIDAPSTKTLGCLQIQIRVSLGRSKSLLRKFEFAKLALAWSLASRFAIHRS